MINKVKTLVFCDFYEYGDVHVMWYLWSESKGSMSIIVLLYKMNGLEI